MTKMISTIFVHLLSIGTVLRLYMTLPAPERDHFAWQISASVICLILALAILWEFLNYRRSAPNQFRFFKARRIKGYMRKWLSSGGRALIFTRDMSWVDDSAIRDVLIEKAR